MKISRPEYAKYFSDPRIIDILINTLTIKFKKRQKDLIDKLYEKEFNQEGLDSWLNKILPIQQELLEAASAGNLEKVKQLLAKDKYNINALDLANYTPLFNAVEQEHIPIVQYLLEHGADIHAQAVTGNTPLHRAIIRDNPQLVRLLLEYGADPWIEDMFGATALDKALQKRIQKF